MRIAVAGGTGFIGRHLVQSLLDDGHDVVVFTRRTPGHEERKRNPRLRYVEWDPAGGAGVGSVGGAGSSDGADVGSAGGAGASSAGGGGVGSAGEGGVGPIEGAVGSAGGPGVSNAAREAVDGADAVVNLAGAPIARRWTAAGKRLIVDSRIDSTRALVQAMAAAKAPPPVFVSASAVGYYGPCGDEYVTESSPAGNDFLADVCRRWEAEAETANRVIETEAAGAEAAGSAEHRPDAGGREGAGLEAGGREGAGPEAAGTRDASFQVAGIRVVTPRIGLVLGDGGALGMMTLPFRLFVGGPLGSGRQWTPWIHIDDVVGLLRFAIDNETIRGPLNATAPEPVRNKEFAKIIGKTMGRPSFMPAPALAMRLVLGEMADMVLTGQRAIPEKGSAAGYRFRYGDPEAALRAVLEG